MLLQDQGGMGGMGGVAVRRSHLTAVAVVPVGRGFDPRLGYFMWVELFVGSRHVSRPVKNKKNRSNIPIFNERWKHELRKSNKTLSNHGPWINNWNNQIRMIFFQLVWNFSISEPTDFNSLKFFFSVFLCISYDISVLQCVRPDWLQITW
jgi:hypothetical protein